MTERNERLIERRRETYRQVESDREKRDVDRETERDIETGRE